MSSEGFARLRGVSCGRFEPRLEDTVPGQSQDLAVSSQTESQYYKRFRAVTLARPSLLVTSVLPVDVLRRGRKHVVGVGRCLVVRVLEAKVALHLLPRSTFRAQRPLNSGGSPPGDGAGHPGALVLRGGRDAASLDTQVVERLGRELIRRGFPDPVHAERD